MYGWCKVTVRSCALRIGAFTGNLPCPPTRLGVCRSGQPGESGRGIYGSSDYAPCVDMGLYLPHRPCRTASNRSQESSARTEVNVHLISKPEPPIRGPRDQLWEHNSTDRRSLGYVRWPESLALIESPTEFCKLSLIKTWSGCVKVLASSAHKFAQPASLRLSRVRILGQLGLLSTDLRVWRDATGDILRPSPGACPPFPGLNLSRWK